MKLATSTLGCPDWTLDEILERLPAYGYDAVELRGLGPDLDLTRAPAFATRAAVTRTRQAFADAGLEICSVDTSASFSDRARAPQQAEDARRAIVLAAVLGAPFIRVFGGAVPEGTSRADAVTSVVENLQALGEYAAQTGPVTIVLETHDAYSTGAQVAEVLARVAHPRVGALWDLHHPYRQGEAPAATYEVLAPYVKHTHVKDSTPDGAYCLLGAGDVPIFDMLRLLHDGGYDGYLCLEWEKRWIPDLADPAEVFPQYAATLRDYPSRLI